MRCAPDLSFLNTIVWYLKQIGAVSVLIMLGLLVLYVIIRIQDR